uniref:Uncharacterized protein n=1 Tax=Arundo donax TaxID=35708 RepID=A0A0A9GC54_ARUDO
MRNHATIASR